MTHVNDKAVNKFDFFFQEPGLEDHFHNLADEITPLYERLVPHAYQNMTAYEEVASACRVGRNPGKPFSGITAVMDFCAHAHKDKHNMHAGLTAVSLGYFCKYFIFVGNGIMWPECCVLQK